MNKKNITLMVVAIATLITFVGLATYAYFVGNINTTRTSNVTATTEINNLVFDTNGGAMQLNVSAANMQRAKNGTVAAQNNTTLTVTLTANTNYSMVCTYDIVYEWTSTDKYTAHSSGVSSNEFTIKASLASNSNTYDGTNNIANETDLSSLTYTNNSTTVVSGAQIDATGSTRSTAVWTFESKIYNANANQINLAGKTFNGKFKVSNVSCVGGTAEKPTQTLADFIINDAPKSGKAKVSNSPWILTSDHEGEYRYAGKNPDNYISFNGELWRIIGVMPNMTYCTGTYKAANECSTGNTATGSLVKIIRNSTLGNIRWDYKQTGVGSSTSTNGSNDWSDSQLQLMLNGTTYLKTGYDKNGNQLHTSYSIENNVVKGRGYNYYNATYSYLDGNGTTVYKPSSATTSAYTATRETIPKKIGSDYINKIATVKWDLYGTGTHDTAVEGSPAAFYNKERNISSTGAVYATGLVENRPAYWYGKVGLMYPSDYGYATNGGDAYDRATCLGYQMSGWSSGSYKTDCAGNSWLWYTGIEGSAPGSSGTNQWTLSPRSSVAVSVFRVVSSGYVRSDVAATTGTAVRPVLYLSADTIYGGEGEGTYSSPYKIG